MVEQIKIKNITGLLFDCAVVITDGAMIKHSSRKDVLSTLGGSKSMLNYR